MVTRTVGQLRIEIVGEEATVQPVGNGEQGTGNGAHPPTASPAMQEKGSRADANSDVRWPGNELREVVRFDEGGRYRPLSGAKTLPGGWRVRCAAEDLNGVIETVYPLATVHAREWERGELRVVSLEEVLARQTGRYAIAASLDEAGQRLAAEVLCGDCVRSPVWAGEVPERRAIPCPEPCSVLVSLCREAAIWQGKRPSSSAIRPEVPYAAFEREGNAIREAYLARMA